MADYEGRRTGRGQRQGPEEDSGVDTALLSEAPAERGESSDARVLAEELDAFHEILPMLMGDAKGKFALIKGRELVGTFETRSDAIKEGYEKFGNVPFLVKQVVELERPLNFVSHAL